MERGPALSVRVRVGAAIEEKLGRENGIPIGEDNAVVVTAGGNMAFVAAVLAIADPGDELMLKMMRACLGENVAPEYAPLMREEMGFVPRDARCL